MTKKFELEVGLFLTWAHLKGSVLADPWEAGWQELRERANSEKFGLGRKF